MAESEIKLKWLDAKNLGLEGQAWADTAEPYDRLARIAQQQVPENIWNLSRSATGMCVHFRSNAYQIHTRWQLQHEALGESNFPITGCSGLDLYGDDHGTWRWVAATHNFSGLHPQVCIVDDLDGVDRSYRLYLPMRNAVRQLEIGVPEQSEIMGISPRLDKPLVFYGSSIVHGAYASHAGIVYPSILGRRLNKPVINLGFSGSAKMEIALAEVIAEIDAHAYIIDALPNMDLNLINERTEAFICRLRECRPFTPIVLVEDFPRTNAWIKNNGLAVIEQKCQRLREIVSTLTERGMGELYLVEGQHLLGDDHEASIDGIHPSDLGYMRMANCIEPVLQRLC